MFDKKAYNKSYRLAHRKDIKAYNKVYYKVYRSAHGEELRAKDRARYLVRCEKMKVYQKAYYLTHCEKIKERTRAWWKLYYPSRKAYLKAQQKKYLQTPEGKETRKRFKAKRKRFGFIPLNEYFLGAEGHHINYNYVIYIPEKLHRSIRHSVISGMSMQKINNKAFKFLAENYEVE